MTPPPLDSAAQAPPPRWTVGRAARIRGLLGSVVLAALVATGCESGGRDLPKVSWASRSTPAGFDVSRNGGPWTPFWPIGVNFGTAIPGTSPGEFAASPEQLRRWIETTAAAGANAIRTYTVQSPAFYRELRAYNMAHLDAPLMLLQGAWIDEPTSDDPDYLSASSTAWVDDEIRKVIGAVYGDIQIPPGSPSNPRNFGRAYGTFDADVSPWLLGWLVGREMEPYTIETTLALHPDAPTSYKGAKLAIVGENAIEAWIVARLDLLVRREAELYGAQHPIGFSNWPTLDPLPHWTEPKIPVSSEDTYQIDLEPITSKGGFTAGVFMSYHAYPYYPDFILHQPEYQSASDAQGKLSYVGYLQALRAHHANHAVLIAEVGHPSCWGNGHQTPSGLDHGGLNEQQQAAATLRSVGAVATAGLHGAFVFAIIDEWFKRAWVVERVEFPTERRQLWHNTMNPEQNFGLIAMRPGAEGERVVLDGADTEWGAPDAVAATTSPFALGDGADGQRKLRDLSVRHDAGWLHIRVRLTLAPGSQLDWSKVDLLLALDTIDPDRGDGRLDPEGRVEVGRRVEFVLRVDDGATARLLVDKPYDLFGLWHGYREAWQLYRSATNDAGLFHPVRTITNAAAEAVDPKTGQLLQIAAQKEQQTGTLAVGSELVDSNAMVAFDAATGVVEVRLPWNLLHFTDPSALQVVDDDGSLGLKRVTAGTTTGVAVAAVLLGGVGEAETALVDSIPPAGKTATGAKLPASGWVDHRWTPWHTVPPYHEAAKPIVKALASGLPGILPASHVLPGAKATGTTP